MRHVFIETNWVVGYAAPAHHQIPAAAELLERASAGELRLYLPSICIAEARRPLHEDFQLRTVADRVRQFLLWARAEAVVSPELEESTRVVLDRMESRVRTDLEKLDDVFESLRKAPGIEIFDLTQETLETCSSLSFLKLGLNPFDQAILSAVLVKSKEILKAGPADVSFCELDGHLQPWDKAGNTKRCPCKAF